ncbi:hypothetical protein PFICI_06194 [Pestalotiopsis fici W106-1]|uniref:Uncharacterized protein n=1 Tax=Pestalotiopsis fici (strain W106-1 / CGMCC3.15140) TaxID=1229662 RepID=W3X717_PESFW|nr:uncharacterized protein PFICI_06194 [Pestalotiopsis fici W106-1]ETS81192.1 hypothetical protein PFICI_06194 [Pestalotiopsis fici W106-1]
MGNGAKAQQKRERNAKDSKVAKSQLKVNQAAMDIQCQICKSTFLKTTRAPQLEQHAQNKHSKAIADCFPTYTAS